MALGIVESIDPVDPTVGAIKEDQTGVVYPYNDPNFPNTGLAVNSPCTYDIDYTQRNPVATNLQPYVPVITEITVPTVGPIVVNPGQTLKVRLGGRVTGGVNVNNGNLIVEDNGEVNCDITVNSQGSLIARQGSKVLGSVNVSSGSALKVGNGGKVTGSVNVIQANRVILGNPQGGGGAPLGGTIIGSLTVDRIRKIIITANSKINP